MKDYQWRRKVCRKADMPSIAIRMTAVRMAHGAKNTKMAGPPTHEFIFRPLRNTIDQSTSDNSARKEQSDGIDQDIAIFGDETSPSVTLKPSSQQLP